VRLLGWEGLKTTERMIQETAAVFSKKAGR